MTAPLLYQDQSVDQLHLTIVQGDLDLKQFQILEQDERTAGDLAVQARIIGASHVISFEYRSCKIHEILACVDVDERCHISFLRSLGGLSQGASLYTDDCRYEFTGSIEDLTKGQMKLQELRRKAHSTSGIGLVFQFPYPVDDGTPLTVVYADTDSMPGSVSVQTAHCYPNNASIVFTETTFKTSGCNS